MAKGNIKGIFIAIELDQSSLKKSVKGAVDFIQSEFASVGKVLGNSLKIDTSKAESSLQNLAKTVNTLQNFVQAQSGVGALSSYIKDNEKLRNSLEEIAKQAGVTAEEFQELYARAVTAEHVNNTVKAFNNYVKTLGLTNEEAIQHAKTLGIVGDALDKITAKYKKVRDTSSLKNLFAEISDISGVKVDPTSSDIAEESALNNIRTATSLLEKYFTSTRKTRDEVIALGKAWKFPEEAIKAFAESHETALERTQRELQEVSDELTKLTGKANVISKEGFIEAQSLTNARQLVSHILKVKEALGLTNNETLLFAKNLDISEKEMGELEKAMGLVERKGKGFFAGLANLITGGNAMAAFQSTLATLGANISTAGFTELAKSMVDVTIKVDSLRTAFSSIYKDSARMEAQLDYIRKVTDELGLEFYSTAEAAKGFFAAAETSKIKNHAEEIFHAFSAASSALKLTQEQTNGVFLAISQMMSKGKISAEEMRQQLAERLPGAVQLLAEAMGVTLEQLDKMFESGSVGIENLVKLAEKVEEVFGKSGREASKAFLGEMNKLKSSWTDFKAEFISSEEITDIIKALQESVEFLKEHINLLRAAVHGLSTAWVAFSAMKFAEMFVNSASAIMMTRKALTDFCKGLTTAQALTTTFGRSLNLVAGAFGAVVGIGTAIWSAISYGAKDAKYSVDYFKEGIYDTSLSMDGFGESTKEAKEQLKELMKLKLEDRLAEARLEVSKIKTSMSSLATAIEEEFLSAYEDVSNAMENGVVNEEWFKQRDALREVQGELKALTEKYENYEISTEQFTAQLKVLIEKYKGLGFEGEQAANLVFRAMTKLNYAVLEESDAVRRLNASMKESEETAKSLLTTVQTVGLSAPKLAFENTKKQAKSSGNTELAATMDLLTSGDLIDANGKKFKANLSDIVKLVEDAKASGKDALKVLQEHYSLSAEITTEISKQVALEKKKDTPATNKKYEDAIDQLKNLRERWTEMSVGAEHASDSYEYAFSKLIDKTKKADLEAERLKNKLATIKELTPSQRDEIYNLTVKINHEEAKRNQEEFFRGYIDTARAALGEYNAMFEGANTENIRLAEKHYAESLQALQDALAAQLIEYEEYLELKKALEDRQSREILNASTDWKDGFAQGAQALQDDASNYAAKWSDITVKGFNGMADALADFATSADASWDSLEQAFSDLAKSIINDIAKMAARAASANIAMGLFGGAGQQGLFTPALNWMGSLFADGGVVNSGLSSFSNGVYNTPTFFTTNGGGFQRYANGGVFGEAGPEAIMPLTRMPNGRLGVAATGGGGNGEVQVNIFNSSNSKAEVRQSESANGGKTIDVLIGDVVAKQMNTPGSKLNRTVSTYTGGQQAVTRR